jgi:lysozyme
MKDKDQESLLIDELIRDEGEILHAYADSLGYLTIGVGRLIDKRRGGGISKEESRYLLSNDIKETESQLDIRLPWWRVLSATRQRVLLNMAFNLGIDGLLGFKNTLLAIKQGDYERAAKGMLASKWAKQVGARANRLAEMMKNGVNREDI